MQCELISYGDGFLSVQEAARILVVSALPAPYLSQINNMWVQTFPAAHEDGEEEDCLFVRFSSSNTENIYNQMSLYSLGHVVISEMHSEFPLKSMEVGFESVNLALTLFWILRIIIIRIQHI